MWLNLLGGIFLCYLGLKTLIVKSTEQRADARGSGLLGAYASTFLLTFTNPMTIISFTAIFAGVYLASTDRSYVSASVLILGVFIGSAMWWIILSSSVGVFQKKINPDRLRWINKISGVIFIGIG